MSPSGDRGEYARSDIPRVKTAQRIDEGGIRAYAPAPFLNYR